METNQIIEAIRNAQKQGLSEIPARLSMLCRGCKNVTLLIDGSRNGNKHDVWVDSPSQRKTLGRIYLGSKNIAQDVDQWNDLIESIGVSK